MIEIIEKGQIPQPKKYRKKCKNCKTIFLYQNEDRELLGICPDDWHYAVKCPVCEIYTISTIFDRREKNK